MSSSSPYQFRELLGVGGMGEVYAALDGRARPVAIKVIAPQHVGSPTMPARLAAEAAACRRIEHRNVVRVLDHGVFADGTPYLAMERVRGRPLGAIVREEGPLAFRRIRRIGEQLLAGLQAIHAAGIVHADLKADNILVDADRQDHVTIIDFGLACAIGTPADERLVSGTPEYMAPEQIQGAPHIPASDLYAAGVVLYELVTGTTPFGGGSPSAVFERHLCDKLVPPTLRIPDRTIPPALERIILRALAKDPDKRPYNAALFATALDHALRSTIEDRVASACPTFSTSAPTCEWKQTTRRPKRNVA